MPIVALCVVPIVVGSILLICARERWLGSPFLWALGVFGVIGAAIVIDPPIGVIERWPWATVLDWEIVFRGDRLSVLFAGVIACLGILIVLYTHAYMHESHLRRMQLYGLLLCFMGAMLGVVFSDHAIILFFFWEITSFCSFGLVAFWHERSDARVGARRALWVTAGGGVALLLGFIGLYALTGSWRISSWMTMGVDSLAGSSFLLLVLLAAMTKSAQFPFQGWLPGAMAAPTPISAYLHSATLVKAGIYVLLRFLPVYTLQSWWGWALMGVGTITYAWGAIGALRQTDAKKILAYSTVSQLGCLCVLLAMVGLAMTTNMPGWIVATAAVMALYHFVHHALWKGALFLFIGLCDHVTHTRDVRQWTGLFWRMPWIGGACTLAMLALLGAPLTSGSYSKKALFALYEAMVIALGEEQRWVVGVIIGGGLVASIGTLVYIGAMLVRLWTKVDGPRNALPPIPILLWIPPVVLVGAGVAWSVFPMHWIGLWLQPAVAEIGMDGVNGQEGLSSALWHGGSWTLAMTVAFWIIGLLGIVGRHAVGRFMGFGAQIVRRSSLTVRWRWRDVRQTLMRSVASIDVHPWQVGGLLLTWLVLVVVSGNWVWEASMFSSKDFFSVAHWGQWPDPLGFVVVAVATIVSAVMMAWRRNRLALVLLLGAVGYGVALLFLWLRAPDLALTQLGVETVGVVLLLFCVRFFSEGETKQHRFRRWTMRGLPIAVGLAVGCLSLIALIPRNTTSLASYFVEQSIPAAKGSNVVNVILVDFRGLDTMLEIVVVGIAALAIMGMSASWKVRPKGGAGGVPTNERDRADNDVAGVSDHSRVCDRPVDRRSS